MRTFITSDLHFNHKNILKFQPNRKEALNCETIEEMNENLIKHWNTNVSDEDTIYHLGDFAFNKAKDILTRLNGTKIFILGNHDNKNSLTSITTHQYLEIKYKVVFNKANILKTNNEDTIKNLSKHYKKEDATPLVANEFGEVFEYIEKDIVLFHFPIRYWNQSDNGALHFHGHTHGHYENFGKSIDVGFDAHNKILTMEEAIDLAKKKPLDNRIYE